MAEALAPWAAVVDARDMGKGGLFEPLVLLAADAANGLEFDSVVVVEPGVIAGETARGLRTLYVALTRPTQRLSVVVPRPLRRPWIAADRRRYRPWAGPPAGPGSTRPPPPRRRHGSSIETVGPP